MPTLLILRKNLMTQTLLVWDGLNFVIGATERSLSCHRVCSKAAFNYTTERSSPRSITGIRRSPSS
jgi:hypothetical protein